MITENYLKHCFWKKVTGDDAKKKKKKTKKIKKIKRGWWKKKKKKTERLTEIQVLTKDFASYKIRYNSLRKRK